MTNQELPNLTSLALFVKTTELGSVGLAAQACGLSQPSASTRLKALERRLGIPLLVRSPAGSRATPEGVVVLDWARQVLESAGSLLVGALAMRQRRGAVLDLAASMTVAEYLLPSWLMTFQSIMPHVNIGFSAVNSARSAEMVLAGECEIGFVEGPRPDPGLKSALVARDRLVIAVSHKHPWARRRTKLQPRELAGTQLISREAGSGTRLTFEQRMDPFGPLAPPLIELNSTSAVKIALLTGSAPAVLSELALQDELRDGRVTEVKIEGIDLSRQLRAVWIEGRPLDGLPLKFLETVSQTRRAAHSVEVRHRERTPV